MVKTLKLNVAREKVDKVDRHQQTDSPVILGAQGKEGGVVVLAMVSGSGEITQKSCPQHLKVNSKSLHLSCSPIKLPDINIKMAPNDILC